MGRVSTCLGVGINMPWEGGINMSWGGGSTCFGKSVNMSGGGGGGGGRY